jgi:hypothetical protein
MEQHCRGTFIFPHPSSPLPGLMWDGVEVASLIYEVQQLELKTWQLLGAQCTSKCKCICMDGWMDGQMDRWVIE